MDYTPEQFVVALKATAVEAAKGFHEVVADTAQDVRRDAQRNARAANPSHARKVPAQIGTTTGKFEAEIGYNDQGQGQLGVILEYGHGGARNAPQRNLGRALDANEEQFERRLADIAERAMPE